MNQKTIVLALTEAGLSHDLKLSSTALSKLYVLSKQDPNVIIDCVLCFLKDTGPAKLSNVQQKSLLQLLERICSESCARLERGVYIELLNFCYQLLDQLNSASAIEALFELEQPLADLLVQLSTQDSESIIQKLLSSEGDQGRLTFSSLNVKCKIRTLGRLLLLNVSNLEKLITPILDVLLSLVPSVRSDDQRQVVAYAVDCVAQALIELFPDATNQPKLIDLGGKNQVDTLNALYEALLCRWLPNCRADRAKEQCIQAIGNLCPLISADKFDELNNQLITTLLHQYRRHGLTLFSVVGGISAKSNFDILGDAPTLSGNLKGNDLHNAEFDNFYVSQALCQAFLISLNRNNMLLPQLRPKQQIAHFDSLISSLFSQLVYTYQCKDQRSRAHNELLRCFTHLAAFYFDRILNLLLSKCEQTAGVQNYEKLATLALLRQLIISNGDQLTGKLQQIFYALSKLLNDQSVDVRRSLIQVIVALAHQGNLAEDGAQILVCFLVRQCAINCSDADATMGNLQSLNETVLVNEISLKQTAEQVLQLLISTVDKIENVLWPLLFDCLIHADFAQASGVICKVLATLAERLSQDEQRWETFQLTFTPYKEEVHKAGEHRNLNPTMTVPPKHLAKELLLARLCVLFGDQNGNGIACAKLAQHLAGQIHPDLNELWSKKLNLLFQDPEKGDLTVDFSTKWRDLMTETVLITINEPKFTQNFARSLLDQLFLYDGLSHLKALSLQLLGTMTDAIATKEFTLHVMVSVCGYVCHDDPIERAATAEMIGICCRRHLDIVLVKLETLLLEAGARGSFFTSLLHPFRSSPIPTDPEKLRATLLLAYGSLVVYGDSVLLPSRLESPILNTLLAQYELLADQPLVQESFLISVQSVANTVSNGRLGESIRLRTRPQLIHQTIRICKNEHTTLANVLKSVHTLTSLVRTSPSLTPFEQKKLLEELCFISSQHVDADDFHSELSQLVSQVVLSANQPNETLVIILEQLQRQLLLTQSNKRLQVRCLQLQLYIITEFTSNLKKDQFCRFEQFSSLVALFLPLCEHSQQSIQRLSLRCLAQLFAADDRLQCRDAEADNALIELNSMADQLDIIPLEQSVGLRTVQLVEKRLQNGHHKATIILNRLLQALEYEQLTENQAALCSMYSQLFNTFASALKSDCAFLLQQLIQSISFVQNHELVKEALNAVHLLFSTHNKMACNLFDFQPLDDKSALFFYRLGFHEQLNRLIIPYLVNLEEEEEEDEDFGANEIDSLVDGVEEGSEEMETKKMESKNKPEKGSDFAALVMSSQRQLNRVSILAQILSNQQTCVLANEFFDQILHFLLLHWAYNHPPVASKDVLTNLQLSIQNAFVHLFVCTKKSRILDHLNFLDQPEQFYGQQGLNDLVKRVVHALSLYQPSVLPKLFRLVIQNHRHSAELHRLTTAFVLQSLSSEASLTHAGTPLLESLLEPLLNESLQMANDPSQSVRKAALDALGSFVYLDHPMVIDTLGTVESVLINALDEKIDVNNELKTVCLQGLCHILKSFDFVLGHDRLVIFVLRLRTFFNEPNVLRSLSIRLFGILMSKQTVYDAMECEARNTLVSLVLFVHDPRSANSDSALFALKETLKHIQSREVSLVIDKFLSGDHKLNYNEFVISISKVLLSVFEESINDFVDALLQFLSQNTAPHRQCDAILFLNHLIANDSHQKIHQSSKEKVVNVLIKLLSESNITEVRVRAVEVLSF